MRNVIWLFSSEPPALKLVCYSNQAVRDAINGWRNDVRCTDLLSLGRWRPPVPAATSEQVTDDVQPAGVEGDQVQPQQEFQQHSSPTEEERARDKIGQKVLDRTFSHCSEVQGETPPYNDSLRAVDLPFNREYGYSNMEGIIRLLDYGEQQGGLVPLTSQLKGSCLFSSFRKSVVCPFEFTNTHLRRMLVMFICEQLDFLYPMLRLSISGNYGHIRVSSTEYNRLRGLSDPTRAQHLQMEEYEEPGPFSIITYMENLLKPSFYGEEICLRLLSMIFQVRITVLDSDTFIGIKIRHDNRPLKADMLLVHVDRHHYIPLGEL